MTDSSARVHLAWMLWVVPACDFQPLPRVTGIDAPDDDAAPGPDAPPDGPTSFLSCMNLAAACGPESSSNCCRAAAVPGGSFYRNYDGAGHNNMAYSATVSLFVMDVFEVTVGRFRAFVDAGMGTRSNPPVGGAGVHPRLAGSGWSTAWNTSLAIDRSALVSAIKCDPQFQTWTDTPGANETKPMNCVTWYEAMAFCIWDGGYLPTEAEWNFTASGGSDQRAYPWSMNPASSTTIDCSYANYFRDSPAGTHCVNGAIGDTLRVGARSPKGDGKWGHSDLAGNVWEWTFDGYGQALPLPCHDCANLQAADRVFRGGDFSGSAASLRVAVRSFNSPFSRDILVGLRCARAL